MKPEDLTDEMIRNFLVGLASKIVGTRDSYAADFKIYAMRHSARVALGERRARRGDSRAAARRRIADAINARKREGGSP